VSSFKAKLDKKLSSEISHTSYDDEILTHLHHPNPRKSPIYRTPLV